MAETTGWWGEKTSKAKNPPEIVAGEDGAVETVAGFLLVVTVDG